MAAAFVAAASGKTGTASALTVTATIPSTVAVGQVLLCHVAQERGAAGLSLSGTGWTTLANVANGTGEQTFLLAWRKIKAGDAGSTVTGTVTTGRRMAMSLAVYSGVNAVAFVQGTSAATGSGSNASTSPSITPAAANCMLVAVNAAVRNNSPWQMRFTESAGWTERTDVTSLSTTSANPQSAVAEKLLSGGSGVSQAGPTWSAIEMTGSTAVNNQFQWPSIVALTPGSFTGSPPTAAFSWTTSRYTVTFDGTGSTDTDGTITGYAWDFGDGTSGTGSKPSHTYTAGSYTVTLTVTDNTVTTGSVSHTVTVATPAAADGYHLLCADGYHTAERYYLATDGWV